MVGTKVLAYDIAVDNADGITIFYNYVNDGKELSVTFENGDTYNSNFITSSYSGNIVIPEEVTYMNRTRKVVSIGEYAFADLVGKNSKITSIVMPKSITSIGSCAFMYCNKLKSIKIPDGVTSIGAMAFHECKNLTSISIPNSVTTINERAFEYCKSLTSIELPNSLKTIDNYAFAYCDNLAAIIIPNSVETIGANAFDGCINLASIDLGNGITSIGFSAFKIVSKVKSIVLPKSLKKIDVNAFSDNDFVSIVSLIETPFVFYGKYSEYMSFSKNTFNNATLYVPKGTIEKYKTKDGWKDFLYIEEGSPTSITNIESADANELKRYTLDGRVIKNSHKGINIIQMNDGTTKKFFVK
jgi:hypothetical protein